MGGDVPRLDTFGVARGDCSERPKASSIRLFGPACARVDDGGVADDGASATCARGGAAS